MYWKFVYWLVIKVLWRSNHHQASFTKVRYGSKLFHWFSSYPEQDGYEWTIRRLTIDEIERRAPLTSVKQPNPTIGGEE